MASVALVDSNVFISLLRGGYDPSVWLTNHLEDIYTCGMVRLEVLRGVREEKQQMRLAGFFDVLCNVTMDNRLWEEAAEIAWRLDRRGLVLPAQDHLIAACARRVGVPVLTADKHFRMMPDVVVMPFTPPS